MANSNTFPHVIEAATLADLASIHVAEHQFGTLCWVDAVGAHFILTATPSGAPNGTTIIAPATGADVGKPGAAWEENAGGSSGGGSPEPSYVEGVAGIRQTDTAGAPEGAFLFDPSLYPATINGLSRTIRFEAVLQSALGDNVQTTTVNLLNLTAGGTTVSSLSTTNSTDPTSVVSGTLAVPGDLPNTEQLYAIELGQTGGGPGDLVTCYNARLRIIYS